MRHSHSGGAHSIAAICQHPVPVATAARLAASQPPRAFIMALGNVSWLQHLQLLFFQVDVIDFTFKFHGQGTCLSGMDEPGLVLWK